MIECAADGSACHLSECAGGCCELRARELKQTLSTYQLESNETPVSIIEELTAPHGLRLLDGDSAVPTHADTAPTRTAQVIRWRGITRHDLPVERILEAAGGADLRVAVVIGYDADGDEYFASSVSDGADVLWLLERLKLQLLTSGEETDPV